MRDYFRRHRTQKWLAIAAASLAVAIAAFLELFDWNLLRPWLARSLSAKTGLEVIIGGSVQVHPWSLHPGVSLDDLRIRNPGWAQQPNAFSATRIRVQISIPHLLRGELLLPLLDLQEPRLNFERRNDGVHNWQPARATARASNPAAPAKLPAIRRLTIDQGRIQADDRVRKLLVNAQMQAGERSSRSGSNGFQLRGHGTINGRRFDLRAQGEALVNIDPDHPYQLDARIKAGDIDAAVQMRIDKPFDFTRFDARFSLSGNDLADAYDLTGLALPNTADYDIRGDLRREGTGFAVRDLRGRIGRSDIQGDAAIDANPQRARPKLTAHLTSSRLELADLLPSLGRRRARLPVGPAGSARAGTVSTVASLFPDADLQVERIRSTDADVTFKGASVTASVPVREVQVHALLENGLLLLQPMSFTLRQGRLTGKVQIDARRSNPESQVDMVLDDADLSQFKPRGGGESPLSGPLLGRIRLHGYGTSVHKFVSHMDGNVNMAVPRGEMRSAFAELTGINLAKALGLLLARSEDRTQLRCAVAAFHASDGQMAANALLLDTTHVLITGHGGIDLHHERVDLEITGKPKSLRVLRLRSPIQIRGPLRKPRVGLDAGKPLLQAGAATVLGALLTPAAAALAFIDPGLEKDANCAAALSAPAGGKAVGER